MYFALLSGALACGGDGSAGGAAGSPARTAGARAQEAAGTGGDRAAASGGAGGRAGAAAGSGGGAGRMAAGAGAAGSDADAGAEPAAGAGAEAGSGAPVQADLPAGVRALFPGPNARDVCADAPLYLRFPSAPKLGSSGKIKVVKMSGEAAATVDLAAQAGTENISGASYNVGQRVWLDGNDVTIVLPAKALAYGESYYVTIDEGVISVGGGAFSISDTTAWKFTTAPAAPSGGATLSVALDGTGQFCSLQAAFDAVPARNANAGPMTIEVAAGKYYGIVNLRSKDQITVRGADRKRTIIAGINNDKLNAGTAKRALFGVDDAKNLTIENLTIKNLTPQGGSQAEALRMQRCDQCVVRDADIWSLQDTLLWSGRIYARNCLIAGNVDFIWGTGTAFFDRCEIRTLGRSGYIVQARNDASIYGYVFVDSKLTSEPATTGNVLARIDSSVYPASHVAYIDCQMDKHISAAGWTVTGGGTGALRFWEYHTTDPAGKTVDISQRLDGSKQLDQDQAAMMRDPKIVLGGWQPPNQ